MLKAIKVIKENGMSTYVSTSGCELCDSCPKLNKSARYENCHINNKTYELINLFGIKIPIIECPSYTGEVDEQKVEPKIDEQQTEPDSTEEVK